MSISYPLWNRYDTVIHAMVALKIGCGAFLMILSIHRQPPDHALTAWFWFLREVRRNRLIIAGKFCAKERDLISMFGQSRHPIHTQHWTVPAFWEKWSQLFSWSWCKCMMVHYLFEITWCKLEGTWTKLPISNFCWVRISYDYEFEVVPLWHISYSSPCWSSSREVSI